MELSNEVILAVVSLISVIAGAAVSKFIPQKGSVENLMIDQLQEQLNQAFTRIEALEGRDKEFQREAREKDDYISELRRHIEERKAPPPPPYPERLR